MDNRVQLKRILESFSGINAAGWIAPDGTVMFRPDYMTHAEQVVKILADIDPEKYRPIADDIDEFLENEPTEVVNEFERTASEDAVQAGYIRFLEDGFQVAKLDEYTLRRIRGFLWDNFPSASKSNTETWVSWGTGNVEVPFAELMDTTVTAKDLVAQGRQPYWAAGKRGSEGSET